ncbi:hypothetical protein CO051_04560 [Candidatus Roizmanbacteria bacterium CG_4_9_14_0_2_um_filter_39_13]|uniref:Uncharacterized protein n=1 Tax=Candidatus Roizmanbacteria bacterium CG_4_9_14_0_2_um_filter_39_13 TaxID=1974839 RepID=A0A2M8EXY0_9BACT|nr:MAG: hypothetical protein CO051_04560 [Candidatus Roizmanbacteria bacterium CG_4_9_14_0_2_um_filter_39_13]
MESSKEQGNKGTREQGNKGTREQRNKGTREQGNKGTRNNKFNKKICHKVLSKCGENKKLIGSFLEK